MNKANSIYSQGDAIFLTSEGMNAKIMSKTRMPIGSRSTARGGGGNVGSITGSINNEAVRQSRTRRDSALKYLEEKALWSGSSDPTPLCLVLEVAAMLCLFLLPSIEAL